MILKILLLILFPFLVYSQYPIIEEFNSLNTFGNWTSTGSAGIQNYGGVENYATFNTGSNPYENNSTVTITSPVYNLSNCNSGLTVTFPLSGIIENNADYMYFQYFNGLSWITLGTFTGFRNNTFSYAIPNTARQFRFRLITDCSANGYKNITSNLCTIVYPSTCTPNLGNCSGSTSVFYYDIARFTISCSILPVELGYFKAELDDNIVNLHWITLSELNNDYFQIERTNNYDFENIGKVNGFGTTILRQEYFFTDYNPLNGVNYYRLKQVDYDGKYEYSNIVYVRLFSNKKIQYIYNILGQQFDNDLLNLPEGIYIIIYDDNTIEKFYKK